jgi:hypothetical protein
MSISGSLEDVPLIDVLQFICLGSKSGTVHATSRGRAVAIGLHRGRIVSATGPRSRRLGDLLIEADVIDQDQLATALDAQRTQTPRRSLGQLLVDFGYVTDDAIRSAIEHQIEETVCDIVGWDSGNFEFLLDELEPIDGIGLYPGDIIPRVELDTQMVIMEATRIFDERRRDDANGVEREPSARYQAVPATRRGTAPRVVRKLLTARGSSTDDTPEPPRCGRVNGSSLPPGRHTESVRPRLQFVSNDDVLLARLAAVVPDKEARVLSVSLTEAGNALPGEPPPVVLIDVRRGAHSAEAIQSVRRARSRASVIAIADSQRGVTHAYEAGALAALPPHAETLAACFVSVLRNRRDLSDEAVIDDGLRAGFAKLRRVFGDLRSGLLSATMSLNLMSIVAESAERAVLFLVRQNGLTALGAFGADEGGAPLAEVTRDLVIPFEQGWAITDAIADGQVRTIALADSELEPALAELVGLPKSGVGTVFPVLGGERVIAVVYADNGRRHDAIREIELLSLATAQVGVAFENEMLRRQVERARARA